jgi:ankyrin repeat protein
MTRLGLVCLLFISAALAADGPSDLFALIRANDLSGLNQALVKGADVNARDGKGITPLMYASAFGSVDAMKMLLKQKADINAQSDIGVTALMWAANEPDRVKLLIDAGADPNVISKMGRSALAIAAARSGNSATVKYLLDHGAKLLPHDRGEWKMPPAPPKEGGFPVPPASLTLNLAAEANDFETLKLLVAAGADPKSVDPAGNSPLQFAAAKCNVQMVRYLISQGANVNQRNKIAGRVKHGPVALTNLSPLIFAAPYCSKHVMAELIEAGAEVNAMDDRGFTPLMAAIASERQDPAVIQYLIAKGAEVNKKNARDETALDWAVKFANPRVLSILKEAGAQTGVAYEAPPKPTGAPSVNAALAKSIELLASSSRQYFNESGGCAGCHHQFLTGMAAGTVQARKIALSSATTDVWKQSRFQLNAQVPVVMQRLDPPGSPDSTLYALTSLALANHAPDATTDAFTWFVAAQQETDGAWHGGGIARPPIEESDFTRTVMAMRVLQLYTTPARKSEYALKINKAKQWLQKEKPVSTEDAVWRLAGLHWAGSDSQVLKAASNELLALQQSDGGWGGNAWLASDAYSTGSAMWALVECGSIKPSDASYKKAAQYLLSTQYADGSWYVRSRAPKFQPYFQSGFPFDHDQWISAAGTAWAVMGLAPSMPLERASK